MRTPAPRGPFAALGLAASPELTDDDVRAAWRRAAAAAHPDRADGGDPARFAEAAAAYTVLRTRFSRNEALADLAAHRGQRRPARRHGAWLRVRGGRPARLAGRGLVAVVVSLVAVRVAGDRPATTAVVVGMVTWLALTAHRDLAGRSQ